MNNRYVALIRKLVRKTGLSVSEIAIEIDSSDKTIYKWLSGTSLPNCEHLLALLTLAEGQQILDR